jgi:hypothetical protein
VIKINFSKNSYWPGEEVDAEVIVSLGKQVKARGLYGVVECVERKHVVTKKYLDHYDFERMKEMGVTPATNIQVSHREEHNKVFHKEFKIAGEREYHKETFSLRFLLPRDAAPTSHDFGHDNKIRLDIPMALDENAEAEIFVEGLGKSI